LYPCGTAADNDSTTGGDAHIFGAQLNTNSLKDYQKTSGTAKTADCMVVVWYNQGGGEDFTQSTAGEQPRIVMGSELVTDSGGKASVYFDGGDTLQNSTLAGQNRLDSYTIQDTSDTTYTCLSDPNSGTRYGLAVENGSSLSSLASGFGTPSYYVNGALQSFADRDASHDALTGSTKLLSQHNASTGAWTGLIVGQYYNGTTSPTYNYTGKISEMVFFANMDSSQKRYPIEQNMIQHFDVNLVANGTFETTSNWFTQGDATINTSTNQAIIDGTSQTSYIVQGVVEEGKTYILTFDVSSDNGTGNRWVTNNLGGGGLYYNITGNGSKSVIFTHSDPSTNLFFTARNGAYFVVSNVKVQEYGTDGYVTTLYDQTQNNNHALQATAANQPKLVSGGDLIKSGNHPAWEYTNSGSTFHNLELFGKIQAAHLDAWFVADTSDDQYIYPSQYNSGSKFGWVIQDGATSGALHLTYGEPDSKLYANGTLISGSGANRDTLQRDLNGRKLVHHQDAQTTSWDNLIVGWYNLGPSSNFGYEGKFSEWIWYDSDQSSNRTGIESNINTHYNIYS
jgi:hypothetical protein